MVIGLKQVDEDDDEGGKNVVDIHGGSVVVRYRRSLGREKCRVERDGLARSIYPGNRGDFGLREVP